MYLSCSSSWCCLTSNDWRSFAKLSWCSFCNELIIFSCFACRTFRGKIRRHAYERMGLTCLDWEVGWEERKVQRNKKNLIFTSNTGISKLAVISGNDKPYKPVYHYQWTCRLQKKLHKKDEEETERGRDKKRRLRAAKPKSFFFFWDFVGFERYLITSQTRVKRVSQDGQVVYPANTFDSRLRGDLRYRLVQVQQNLTNKKEEKSSQHLTTMPSAFPAASFFSALTWLAETRDGDIFVSVG